MLMIDQLNLFLFGEGTGSGDAGAAGAAQATQGNGSGTQGEPAAIPKGANKRGKENPLANVVYGKQGEASTQQRAGVASPKETRTMAPEETRTMAPKETRTIVTTKETEDRKAAFEEYIAQNKDLYDERVNAALQRRFKNQADLQGQLDAAQPVLDILMEKYGAADMEGLRKAIDEDESYFEDAANERGLTVAQYKEFRRMEKENAAFRQAAEEARIQQGFQQDAQRWMQEAEALKARYPGFDLEGEINHPETGQRFIDLLRAKVDVGTAYQIIHMDELMSGAIGYAVQTAQKKTMDDIRARGMRPSENGAGGNGAGMIVKKDPSTFTKADREEISRRVQRGERIEL